jgi:hypothetical protein
METAERTLGVVSLPGRPSCNDGSNDARCVLCGDPLACAATGWLHAPGDPPDLRRVAHARCIHECGLLECALGSHATS